MANIENTEMFVAILIAIVIAVTVIAIIITLYISNKLGSKKGIFKNTSLEKVQKIEDGYIGVPQELKKIVGHEGVANTDLRPGGKIEIGDFLYDAVSITGFISKESKIRVIKYENSQLYVKELNSTNKHI